MKRDFDLIRKIMLYYESADPGTTIDDTPELDGYDQNAIIEHIIMLIDAGYLHGNVITTMSSPTDVFVSSISWNGHEFLGAMRDDTIWKKARETVLKPGLSITISTLIEWLVTQARQKLFNQ